MRIVLIVSALALSACASAAPPGTASNELARLTADCHARGGVLSPTGSQSGRPQLDNVCKITAQPSNR